MIKYLLKRKKNIVLFFVLGLINKVILHYLFFPIQDRVRVGTAKSSGISFNPLETGYEPIYGEPFRKTIGEHILTIFVDSNPFDNFNELYLFIPAYLLVGFFAWYFGDKIKAR